MHRKFVAEAFAIDLQLAAFLRLPSKNASVSDGIDHTSNEENLSHSDSAVSKIDLCS